MTDCSTWESTMFDVACGSADEADRLLLERHIDSCSTCRQALEEMKRQLPLEPLHRSDPGDAYWSAFTDDILRQTVRNTKERPALRRISNPHARTFVQIAAAIVILIGGVWIGRSSTQTVQNSGSDLTEQETLQPPATLLPASLQERTDAYLDRSRTLLLGLVNFTEGEDDPMSLNLMRRKDMAGELIRESSDLQRDLSDADQRRLRELISDLEVILLQIANLESEYDLPGIEMLKSGVDRKAILFKIQVEEMRRFDATESTSRTPAANPAV